MTTKTYETPMKIQVCPEQSHPQMVINPKKITANVTKYVENSLVENWPPFQENQLKMFSNKKIKPKKIDNVSRKLLGFRNSVRASSQKHKNSLVDWRKLMNKSVSITNTNANNKNDDKIHKQRVNINNQNNVNTQHKDNNSQHYLQCALVQNYYDVQLNLSDLSRTNKVQKFYKNSERPSSTHQSFRRFTQNIPQKDSSQVKNIPERKSLTSYGRFIHSQRQQTRPKINVNKLNKTAKYKEPNNQMHEQFGRNQLNLSMFQNSEIKKININQFNIVNTPQNIAPQFKYQNFPNKSQFLKQVHIRKYEKAKIKNTLLFKQHIPRSISNRQPIHKSILKVKTAKGFLFSGKNES